MCQLQPLLLCSILQIIRSLSLSGHALHNSLQKTRKSLIQLQDKVQPMGLLDHKHRNNNSNHKSSINRRMTCMYNYHEYMNQTVNEDIDLLSCLVFDEIKHNEMYREGWREHYRKEFVEEQKAYMRDLRNNVEIKDKIALTTVRHGLTQRECVGYRTSV